jgi:hypothetical protein
MRAIEIHIADANFIVAARPQEEANHSSNFSAAKNDNFFHE